MSSKDRDYRPDIDGLRAVAILLVLGFHAFPAAVPGGFIGVDVFFVISGYLIGGIILNDLNAGAFSLSNFYARRIRRIFPALAIMLLAVYALGWNLLLAAEFKQLGKDIAAGAGFISNLVLWGETDYFDRAAETKPLLHLWSLGIEEQFYILWPLLLRISYKRTTVLLVAFALLSFLLCFYLTGTNPAAAFFSPLSRCWELACGTLLFWYQRAQTLPATEDLKSERRNWLGASVPGGAKKHFIAAAGLLVIAVPALALGRNANFPGAWAILPVSGALLLIYAGAEAWLNRVLLSSRLFVWIGLLSYSIYLWHWPLLTFLRISRSTAPTTLERVAAILLSVLLAWLTYMLVEKPLRSGPRSRAKIAFLCIALSALCGLGLHAYLDDGIKSRYPKIIQQITDVTFSVMNQAREDKCFLSPEMDASKFADECLQKGRRPLVFIWGDSHAGSLYPGLVDAQKNYDFGIGQYTASACPPLLGITNPNRPFCRQINDYVASLIASIKPDVVFLDANWNFSIGSVWHDAYDLRLLDDTVNRLKQAGVAHIVILGSAPIWEENLSRILLLNWQNDPLHRDPPLRLVPKRDLESKANDRVMREIAQRLGAEFISVYDILCNADGCLTRLTRDDYNITASDSEHMTPHAAGYVMNQIFATHRYARPH